MRGSPHGDSEHTQNSLDLFNKFSLRLHFRHLRRYQVAVGDRGNLPKRVISLALRGPDLTLRKSPRTSDSQSSGPCKSAFIGLSVEYECTILFLTS